MVYFGHLLRVVFALHFSSVLAKVKGERFEALDRPMQRHATPPGAFEENEHDARFGADC